MLGVHQEFNVLIGEESPHHQTEDHHWTTLWDGQWDDEESIEWIAQSQPEWPAEKMWQLLKSFHEENKKRSIGNRGRLVLDKLIPLLLSYLVDLKADETALERILLIIDNKSSVLPVLFINIEFCSPSISFITDVSFDFSIKKCWFAKLLNCG